MSSAIFLKNMLQKLISQAAQKLIKVEDDEQKKALLDELVNIINMLLVTVLSDTLETKYKDNIIQAVSRTFQVVVLFAREELSDYLSQVIKGIVQKISDTLKPSVPENSQIGAIMFSAELAKIASEDIFIQICEVLLNSLSELTKHHIDTFKNAIHNLN